jgi:hypothetical protein
LAKFFAIVSRLKDILKRFLDVLRCIDVACIGGTQLDELPTPTRVGQICVGGIDLNKPRTRAVLEAVTALAPRSPGIRCADLAAKVQTITVANGSAYTHAKPPMT